jgi:hypothetical protein
MSCGEEVQTYAKRPLRVSIGSQSLKQSTSMGRKFETWIKNLNLTMSVRHRLG